MTEQSNANSFSLYELNEHLKRIVAFNMRQAIWVKCEVADVSSSKGNVFLSLVQRDDFELKAKAEGMIWRKDLNKISQKIGDSLWSILQIGRQVLLQVQVEFHEYYGLKLLIKDIDPSVTIGQVELQRLQIRKKLEAEQFTSLNAQLPPPLVWQRLAIISSSQAAGLQDFLNQLKTNPYQYRYQFELFEAVMQGVNTPSEVMKQLQKIEERKEAFDAVIIVRGGGARLDLMGFDDYDLCVAIATCELPVLTGIGHDIDETLADIVAFSPLKTPTAVADFLIHKSLEFESYIHQVQQQIQQRIAQRVQGEEYQLERLVERIQNSVERRLEKEQQALNVIQQKLTLLNPKSILERGFAAITDEDGNKIASIEQLQKEQTYTLLLADGQIEITLK